MARPLVAYCYVRAFSPPEGERYLVTLSGGLLTCRGLQGPYGTSFGGVVLHQGLPSTWGER